MCGRGLNLTPISDTMLEDPPLPVQLYNSGDMEGVEGLLYYGSTFSLLCESWAPTTYSVNIKICENYYAQ
jgi:hypothetical protein